MKNKIILFVLILSMIFSLMGCSSGSNKDLSGDASKEEVKIAYIGPLTGDASPWGIAELNTIKLLVEEINEEGGILDRKKIKLYSYDNRSDNVETTNAARKAINDDGVCVIIGTNSSSNSIALAGICEELKVPHIATTATNPLVTVKEDGSVRPYSFRMGITDPQIGAIAANFAFTDLEAKTAAILYEIGSDYSLGLQEAFAKNFSEKGGEIVAIEAYKTGDVDFRPQFSKIKGKDPDVIFLPALYKEIALATSQARDLGIDAPFIGGDSWLNDDLFTLAPGAVVGSYFVNPVNREDPILNDFKEKYRNKYNEEPDAAGGNAYYAHDIIITLTAAIEESGSVDPEKIRDALENIKNIQGLTGETSMDKETHNPIKTASVFKILIDPNRFEFIKKIGQ